MKPSEILLAAREKQAIGHVKHALISIDDTGQPSAFCMVGALYEAGKHDWGSTVEAKVFLEKALDCEPNCGVSETNNSPNFTHLDAVEAFERAWCLAVEAGQ